jgi:putative endonuclease
LVEQLTLNQRVQGSSPCASTIRRLHKVHFLTCPEPADGWQAARTAYSLTHQLSRVECPELVEGPFMPWYTYILECADRSYYVGHTSHPPSRIIRHNSGDGSVHTAARLPAHVVYVEEFGTQANAMARERQLKKWSRAKKKALIEGDLEELRRLSKSHD